jgi:hypothetical protein
MPIWFTVKLDDRPGSLGRVTTALGDQGINITGIVGVAEDTGGSLMLTTSDAAGTRAVFAERGIAFTEHDSDSPAVAEGLDGVRRGLADRGMDVEAR